MLPWFSSFHILILKKKNWFCALLKHLFSFTSTCHYVIGVYFTDNSALYSWPAICYLTYLSSILQRVQSCISFFSLYILYCKTPENESIHNLSCHTIQRFEFKHINIFSVKHGISGGPAGGLPEGAADEIKKHADNLTPSQFGVANDKINRKQIHRKLCVGVGTTAASTWKHRTHSHMACLGCFYWK